MSIDDLRNYVINKKHFVNIDDYISFGKSYLKYIETGLQATIVSQNENNYRFLQYKKDGYHNITRPLNSNLMCFELELFLEKAEGFKQVIKNLKEREFPKDDYRENIIRTIYTIQQSIGAVLDALPSGRSNQARKINGDLFENFVRLLIVSLGIDCVSGIIQVPVRDDNGNELFKSSYQHDLMIKKEDELKIIGSVKTSSKDRIDKVFMDKFLYNKLTGTALPHIAIFLNDVQRKKAKKENEYGISATFLPGHFKAYTIKLNALDGVYYCDIRPNMVDDDLLNKHIKTIDHFFYTDIWELLNRKGQKLDEIKIEDGLI